MTLVEIGRLHEPDVLLAMFLRQALLQIEVLRDLLVTRHEGEIFLIFSPRFEDEARGRGVEGSILLAGGLRIRGVEMAQRPHQPGLGRYQSQRVDVVHDLSKDFSEAITSGFTYFLWLLILSILGRSRDGYCRGRQTKLSWSRSFSSSSSPLTGS